MLHSGSRGPGNRIGTVYIELAKNDMMKLDKRIKVISHFENLPSNKVITIKLPPSKDSEANARNVSFIIFLR